MPPESIHRTPTNPSRFEKSLYDLIKGLRNHKGGEDEYIQACLRECKAEIKTQDMDKKATALLKLIYLEMFGYDMSWASFHVLEVMSSAKYLPKRVGYLGAVQSFRPDTEVLMLATNLLKKDIASASVPNMSLPLITLPHFSTSSLAMSVLSDVLSRLSHSNPVVRKKSIVCLYRLALVYPEALKLAWPKIKDRLMDEEEDSSVTSAAINVVCELGWRRPHDFLPLAPRFFELLVDSGNNWMAIKIIKLFATLTPLEPRLTRKLLRPLTNIIQTTSAMSLLYECINGIIQGGILDGEDGLQERDDVASLCVGKLRGMIVMDADPNLKYVALLALNRIVTTHPELVAMQQDVIMHCLDDADISIRLQALDLAAGMVTSDTLQPVVNRLVDQLRLLPSSTSRPSSSHMAEDPDDDKRLSDQYSPAMTAVLPSDYRIEVLHRVLDMCSHNNYSEIVDFEWYVGILVQLVGLLPPSEPADHWMQTHPDLDATALSRTDVAFRIGSEIQSLILIDNRSTLFPAGSILGDGVLGPVAWVVGEFADYLSSPSRCLQSLIDISHVTLPARTLSLFLQAIPKVLVQVSRSGQQGAPSWRSEISLLLARVVEFLDALAAHPDLDVQERAIEFLEILRLAAEAMQSGGEDMPFLLASVIPSLFTGLELNPVASTAQKKVALPDSLRLDEAFNDNLPILLHDRDYISLGSSDPHILQDFYYVPDRTLLSHKPSHDVAPADAPFNPSYQNFPDMGEVERRRVERRERFRDDPFYIAPSDASSGGSTPFHEILNTSNGDGLDIDSIPIVDLKLGDEASGPPGQAPRRDRRPRPRKMEVAGDETFGAEDLSGGDATFGTAGRSTGQSRSLLQVDSSGLGQLSFAGDDRAQPQLSADEGETEMIKAMQRVEEVRLRMQRASERIQLEGTPAEGTLVKRKKKKKKKDGAESVEKSGPKKKKKGSAMSPTG
ncbi:hypothetical protein N7474_003870 [Penicillium riverlandense]|uniref:uncharacterized protein n=1 Tax=Penicillium riverlandense TaxID=1903569 RepID=UPI0025474109|nr:uncharacterized protein N7474_003870 [Penicillium riverlandense]KAJ5818279.1 hypothetical protein N7474_003870 [Penicillium riverlandense]